jgi:AhpD family alkylhydroperoxidase
MNMNPKTCSEPSAPGACARPPQPRDAASLFVPEVAELVAIGAAIAANCEPCLRHHTRLARSLGISAADIDRAVETATAVKATPHQNILKLAARLTSADGATATEAEGDCATPATGDCATRPAPAGRSCCG